MHEKNAINLHTVFLPHFSVLVICYQTQRDFKTVGNLQKEDTKWHLLEVLQSGFAQGEGWVSENRGGGANHNPSSSGFTKEHQKLTFQPWKVSSATEKLFSLLKMSVANGNLWGASKVFFGGGMINIWHYPFGFQILGCSLVNLAPEMWGPKF